MNFNTILLTGGEPTIHPYFKEIVKEISKKKIKQSIVSNGSQTSNLNYFLSLKPKEIFISFYSFNPKIDEYLSQSHYYNNRISTINELSKNNNNSTQLIANIVLNKHTIKNLQETINKLHSLNFKVKISFPSLSHRFKKHYKQLYLSIKETKIIMNNITPDFVENMPMCTNPKNIPSMSLESLGINFITTPTKNLKIIEINNDNNKTRVDFCKNCTKCLGFNKNEVDLINLLEQNN